MPFPFRRLLALVAVCAAALFIAGCSFIGGGKENAPLSAEAIQRLTEINSDRSQPMLVRIFKESSELEVWKQTKRGNYALFRTYKICAWSGVLGPKIKEGDRQAPEGFYTITPGLMNPKSSYYLSFNTGFPNKFDRAWGRTGTNLMVHGSCSSAGCYAMTDPQIAEIYALARDSFRGGNKSFQLQVFPFRMTEANLQKHADSPHLAFWNNIKQGYDAFEASKQAVAWDVCERKYVFNVSAPDGVALDAAGPCPAGVAGETIQIAQIANPPAPGGADGAPAPAPAPAPAR